MSKNTFTFSKPLKGASIDIGTANIGTLNSDSLILPQSAVDNLISGSILNNVIITDSEINNSIIGAGGSNSAVFNELSAEGDVIFYNTDHTKNFTWDSVSGKVVLNNATLSVDGCATISNLQICGNTISAINNNGNVNLVPNGLGGGIFLRGPVNNIVVSQGSYLTSLANGGITMLCTDSVILTSLSSSSTINTFNGQTFNSSNGDITFNTDLSLTSKGISNAVKNTSGITVITSSTSSFVNVNDTVVITGSITAVNGTFSVTNVYSNLSFGVSTASFSGNSTTGNFIKLANNDINLNASRYVKIPINIPIIYGTTGQYITGMSNGLSVVSQSVYLSTGTIFVPQGSLLQFGTSSNHISMTDELLIKSTSDILTSSGNVYMKTGDFSLTSSNTYIESNSIYLKDAVPMIANYTQTLGDSSDRGIQYRHYDSGSSLGWFGVKKSTGNFTFYKNAINTSDVITGTLGNLEVSSLVSNSILTNNVSCSSINVNCGSIANLSLITGCNGGLSILSTGGISVTTGNLNLVVSSVNIPTNSLINVGTSSIVDTLSNLKLTSSSIILNSSSVKIPISSRFQLDNVGNQEIYSDVASDIYIKGNSNLFLTFTSGNVVVPENTSIRFGNAIEKIYGNTEGLFISGTSVNISSISSSSLVSSNGSLTLRSYNGNISLLASAKVELNSNTFLTFDNNNTSNSIISTGGNLIINGVNASIKSNVINLSSGTINIPSTSIINVGSSSIVSSSDALFLSSGSLKISNTTSNVSVLNLNITSSNLNIRSSNVNISSSDTFIQSDFRLSDPIPTLADYTQSIGDLTDRGIQYRHYDSGNSLGWFGVKKSTGQFTFYKNAINTSDVITGTLGSIEAGNITLSGSITTGNLNIACGSISNVYALSGCGNELRILAQSGMSVSSSQVSFDANVLQLPLSSIISFGNTGNSVTSTNDTMTLNVGAGSGTLVVNSNLRVNGTVNNVYSTITNYLDPIINIGSISGTTSSLDDKDRGIQFFYNDGNNKQGFFGFKKNTQRFSYYTSETNNNEIITGTLGDVDFGIGYLTSLDVQGGTISNVSTLKSSSLSIISSSAASFDAPSLLLSGTLYINSTSTSLNSTLGNLNINSSSINLNSDIININSSSSFLVTNGNLILDTSKLYLNSDEIIVPSGVYLSFDSTSTSISGDSTNLYLYGNTITYGSSTIDNDLIVHGDTNTESLTVLKDTYISPLGTYRGSDIENITSSSSSGILQVTTIIPHEATTGQTAVFSNSSIDGFSTVNSVLTNKIFTIVHSPASGSVGNVKFVSSNGSGLNLNYWQGNTLSSTFLGLNGSNTLVYYSRALVSGNTVSGSLGNMAVSSLSTNFLTGNTGSITLSSVFDANTHIVQGSNFIISGGSIDNTPIGQTTPRQGSFTTLTNQNSASLTDVTLTSTLKYSVDKISLSSLVPIASPDLAKISTFVTVTGNGFSGVGTLGSSIDGQVKKITLSSCGSGGSYNLAFSRLVSPNPLGGTASGMIFKRGGQSAEVIWDSTAINSTTGAWIITGGNGAYVY